jgi:hypothetical protein
VQYALLTLALILLTAGLCAVLERVQRAWRTLRAPRPACAPQPG